MANKKSGCAGCTPGAAYSSQRKINAQKYPQPTVKEDGSLLFKTLAPSLPGYSHDPINTKRLIPDTLPCTKRMTLPVLQRDGKYVVMNKCNHSECKLRGQEVNKDICSTCDFRVPLRVVSQLSSTPPIDPKSSEIDDQN